MRDSENITCGSAPASVCGTSRRNRKVFVVAGFPPPPGGIAVHAERLCHLLLREGYDVVAYETNRKNKVPVSRAFRCYSASGLRTNIRLAADAFFERPGLVHMHVSAIGNPVAFILGVHWISVSAPVIITVHSGSFPDKAARLGKNARFMLKTAFARATHIVATSNPIKGALIEHFGVPPARITVIPAFLRPPDDRAVRRAGPEPGVVLASGYGTRTYFWEGLIEAARSVPDLRELVLAFYTQFEPGYYEGILEKARGKFGFKVTIHENLSNDEFLSELARCSVFVRPTFTDGDSIALREALALGRIVVASDAVPRPEGCVLFRSGDVNDLRVKLAAATSSVSSSRAAGQDFSQPILQLYKRVIFKGD